LVLAGLVEVAFVEGDGVGRILAHEGGSESGEALKLVVVECRTQCRKGRGKQGGMRKRDEFGGVGGGDGIGGMRVWT
jgi:hypothetical protein